jgi:stress-induced morphogen
VSLRILSSPDPAPIAARLREAIAAALPDARIEVRPTGPGHFEITVASRAFEGLPLVRQQQKVYQAIAQLMAGDAPPVHAIDRLETRLP